MATRKTSSRKKAVLAAESLLGLSTEPKLEAPRERQEGEHPLAVPADKAPIGWLETNMKDLGRLGRIMLSRRVAIIGDTRSGKTGIADGVEFALTARHRLAGNLPARLRSLAPQGMPELYAAVGGGIIGEARSAMHIADGVAERPVQAPNAYLQALSADDKDALFPTTNEEWLEEGDKLTRESVLRRYGLPITLPDVAASAPAHAVLWSNLIRKVTGPVALTPGKPAPLPATLSATQLTTLSELLRGPERTAVNAQLIAAQNEVAAAEADFAAKSVGAENKAALEAVVARYTAYIQAAQAREELARANEARDALEREEASFVANAALEETIASARALVTRTSEQIVQLEGSRVGLAAAVAQLHGELREATLGASSRSAWMAGVDSLLEAMVRADIHECQVPRCNGVIDDPSLSRQELAGFMAKIHEEQAARNTRIQAAEKALADCDANLSRLRFQLRSAESQGKGLEATYQAQRSSLISRIQTADARIESLSAAIPPGATECPPAEEVKSASAQLHSIAQAEAAAAAVKRRKEALLAALAADTSLQWVTQTVSKLLQAALLETAGRAEAEVNTWAIPGHSAALILTETQCVWGAREPKSGAPLPKWALSGSERTSLKLARVLAQGAGAPCCILRLDDEDLGPFHSDRAALSAFMNRIDGYVTSNHVHMAIVSGLRREEVPDGWTVIDLREHA